MFINYIFILHQIYYTHTHTPKTTSFPQKNLEFHGLASMDSFSFSKNKSGPKAPTNGARQRPHVRLDGDGIP